MALPYLLRILGPRSYGSIIFAQSLIGYAVILTEYGFTFTAARDVSVARNDPGTTARIFWSTMAAKFVLMCVAVAVLATLVAVVPQFRADWRMFAVCSALLVGNVAFPQWYLLGIGRLRDAAIAQTTAKVVVLIGIYTLVHTRSDSLLAAFLMSGSQLFGTLALMCLGRTHAPTIRHAPAIADIRRSLTDGWHMFLGSASTTLYLQTNSFVLGLACGTTAVAYYSLGYSVALAVQGLASPITQLYFPRLSLLFSTDSKRALIELKKLAALLLPAMTAISVLVLIFAKPIVLMVGGASYGPAVSILRILTLLPPLITLATLLGPLALVNLRMTSELMRIYVGVGVLNVALLPVLVSRYAGDGAAVALVVAEALGPLLMLRALTRRRRT